MGGIPDLDKIRCVVSAKLEVPEPHVAGRKRGYGALPVALVVTKAELMGPIDPDGERGSNQRIHTYLFVFLPPF